MSLSVKKFLEHILDTVKMMQSTDYHYDWRYTQLYQEMDYIKDQLEEILQKYFDKSYLELRSK